MKRLLKKIAKFFIRLGLSILMDKEVLMYAQDIVTAINVNLPKMADNKRRNYAKDVIRSRVKASGKKIKDRLINLAIEYIVNEIKEEL